LVIQSMSTATPMPNPRIRRGNISERQTQTGTLSIICMEKTNRPMTARMR
jgi:hypothetical protein